MQRNRQSDDAARPAIVVVTSMTSRTPSIRLRPAAVGDAETVARFNALMAEETEHLRLDPGRLLDGVRAVLSDPAKGFYTLAEIDGAIAGQMMITYEWSDWRNGNFWWIQSVYVDVPYRGGGVYRALYNHIERRARSEGACGLRLYVERENSRAQQTYRRCGMMETGYQMYEVDFVLTR